MDKCLICMGNLENIFCFLTCNCVVAYHPKCINKWLSINKKCPTCNKEFKNRCNSTTKLLEHAMFYDSIGRFDVFRRSSLFISLEF